MAEKRSRTIFFWQSATEMLTEGASRISHAWPTGGILSDGEVFMPTLCHWGKKSACHRDGAFAGEPWMALRVARADGPLESQAR